MGDFNVNKIIDKASLKKATYNHILSLFALIVVSVFHNSMYGGTFRTIIPMLIICIIEIIYHFDYTFSKKNSLYVLFFLVCLLSNIINKNLTRETVSFLAFVIVFLYCTGKDYTKEDMHNVLTFYLAIAIIVEICMLFNFKNTADEWFNRAYFQFLGVRKDPNYTMAFIAPMCFIPFYRFASLKTIKEKVIYYCIFVFAALTTILVGSRGAIVSILAALLFFLIFSKKLSLKEKGIALLGLIVCLIILFIVGSFLLNDNSTNRLMDYSDGSIRVEIWENDSKAFLEKPIFGGGTNAARDEFRYSHNVYLDILCDYGIVGALAFIAFAIFNMAYCKKEDIPFLWALDVTMMGPMFFINGLNTTTWYLPIILSTILANTSLKSDEDIVW